MVKILSPVTSLEATIGVVSAGADEIYCGVSIPGIEYMGLSTRYKRCSLPSYDELGKVVSYAHDHGVRAIATTELPFMTEMIEKEVENHIRSCVEKEVDAIIATDLGIILMVKDMGLDIPIYASTYIASMNYEAVDLLRELGIKRIMVERHLAIKEIAEIIKHSKGVEIEVFIHGSGCSNINVSCYGCPSVFSIKDFSQLQNVQIQFTPCLTTYDVYEFNSGRGRKITNTAILDAYTYCSICKLPDLVKAGVEYFKIVGRCQSKVYQIETTKIYHELLNILEQGNIESFLERIDNMRDNIPEYIMPKIVCVQKRCYYSEFFHSPYKIPV